MVQGLLPVASAEGVLARAGHAENGPAASASSSGWWRRWRRRAGQLSHPDEDELQRVVISHEDQTGGAVTVGGRGQGRR
jgi:hypothetical protein